MLEFWTNHARWPFQVVVLRAENSSRIAALKLAECADLIRPSMTTFPNVALVWRVARIPFPPETVAIESATVTVPAVFQIVLLTLDPEKSSNRSKTSAPSLSLVADALP